MAAGEVADARAGYEHAAALAKRAGDGEQLARAVFGLGVEFTAGTVDELKVRLLEETLAVLGETDTLLRARVLGRLAKALQAEPDPARRAALSETAVAMARRIGDPVALAAVLYDRHMATWAPGNLLERRAISAEVVRLAEASGDGVMALRGRGFLMANLLELGDMAALAEELDTYRHAAERLRQPHFLWHVPLFDAGQAVLHGRFDDAERLAGEALALGRRARDPVVAIYYPIILTGLRFGQGRLPELERTLAEFVGRSPSNLGWRATLAVLLCEAGRAGEARAHFERLAADGFAGLPRNHLFVYHAVALAIVAHALGDADRAAALSGLLAPTPTTMSWPPGCRSARSARSGSTSGCWPRPRRTGTTRWPSSTPPPAPTSASAPCRCRPAAATTTRGRCWPAAARPTGNGRGSTWNGPKRSPAGWGCAGWRSARPVPDRRL
jgi:hypothetical protein